MSGRVLPSMWLNVPLANGVGRYVNQLQRITIKFCKSRSDSRGVRDYIQNGLLDFSRQNPGTVVYVKPRRMRQPLLVGEYLSGHWQWVSMKNFSDEDVHKWMELFRTRTGHDIMRLRNNLRTHHPSTQGVWHPMLHRDTGDNRRTLYELREMGQFQPPDKDATEVLRYLYEVQSRRLPDTDTPLD